MNDKDQAAIVDHVASVSNNPHAALIVKQLITGWDVEIKQSGEWITLSGGIKPSWSKNCEYRLIEPKPAKPAYRVYKLSNGMTSTEDRYEDGHVSNMLGNDAIPISDWIEYDQPKKWPTTLVERIAAIDIKAAEWIVDHWDELLDDKYTYKGNYSRDCDTLTHMFEWEAPPQGLEYWGSISDKLGE